jgi:hypothetical protein
LLIDFCVELSIDTFLLFELRNRLIVLGIQLGESVFLLSEFHRGRIQLFTGIEFAYQKENAKTKECRDGYTHDSGDAFLAVAAIRGAVIRRRGLIEIGGSTHNF